MWMMILLTGRIMASYKIPVNLIRQWHFCPRIVYYRELLNVQANKSLWVKQGEDKHLDFSKLIRRRKFANIGIENGKRHFNVSMESSKYPLLGIADLIIECDDAVYPVDYKSSYKIYRGQIMQMVAYCLLAQERFSKPSPCGIFIYGDNGKMTKLLKITPDLVQQTINACQDIEDMLNKSIKPNSDASIHQCMQCEYLNYCNDRGE